MIRRPLISYYGSRWKLALSGYYPPPLHDHIIEPFAGGAGYALQWYDRQVTLIDLDETLCGVWRYLIGATTSEIRNLPLLEVGQSTKDIAWPCEEARNLAGYWCSIANTYPCDHLSPWAARDGRSGWSTRLLQHLAQAIEKIRHWKIIHGEYQDSPQGIATRFVDAPFQGSKGRKYRHGSSKIDYPKLGEWCLEQPGQLIVCEGIGADWLPFEPLTKQWGSKGFSDEVIYLQGEQAGQLQL